MSNSTDDHDYAEEILNDVRRQIAADDKVLAAARERRNDVTRIARKFDGALRSFGSGSVAHGTVNAPVSDADAGVVLDRRRYPELGPDGDGGGPTDIVTRIAQFVLEELRETYPGVIAEVTKRAILFEFGEPVSDEEDPSVDLVVALTRRDEPGLWIPNTERDDWDASDPEKHTELLTGEDRSLRVHRARVIRLGKAGIKQDGDQAVLSSFNVEAEALRQVTEIQTLGESLRDLFLGAADAIDDGNTPDPAGVSDPIKLPDGISRERAVNRLRAFGRWAAEAVESRSEEAAARLALSELFFNCVDPPVPAASRSLADELRRGAPGPAAASVLGPGADSLKRTSAYGDEPAS